MVKPSSDIVAQPENWDVDIGRVYGGLNALQISARLADAQFALLFANRAMGRLPYDDTRYWAARPRLDRAALHVHRAKWFTGRATGLLSGVEEPTGSDNDVATGLAEAVCAEALARSVFTYLSSESGEDLPALPYFLLDYSVAETAYVDGIPVVPSVCPIILLRGSSFDMGWQYAQQAIEIFGPFVFARYGRQRFTTKQYKHLTLWEEELARHTPEILDMARGWAEGATAAGVPMTYESALTLWTTDLPPATAPEAMMDSASELFAAAYAGVSAQRSATAASVVDNATDLCSGACAWGEATRSGKMVAAATTDHDCWFQATIMAYPDTGHPFIFTPFSANGWLPGLGNTTMAGLPGVNAKGLVLVHHGGDPKMAEPPSTWGWGIRKGAAIFHILRFAETAEQARELEMSWPISDVGRMMGAPGALWADAEGAYVAESRARSNVQPEGLLRTHTLDAQGRSHPFLYVTNNALHPDARRANGGGEDGLNWSLTGGWHTKDPAVIAAGETTQDCFARWASKHSAGRNRFFAARLFKGEGRIDLDWLLDLYRSPGEYPSHEAWQDKMASYRVGGDLECSPAHRGNAFTVAIDPTAEGGPLYMGCVGPARRDLPPRDNSHGFHYFDETNAFWRLRLRDTPEAAVSAAEAEAQTLVQCARERIGRAPEAAAPTTKAWLQAAEGALDDGAARLAGEGGRSSKSDGLGNLARALRAFSRAQVRAQQVLDVVEPPRGLDTAEPR